MTNCRNADDVWFWACTSPDLHLVVAEAHLELRPHRPEAVDRALDRLYRRRRLGPGQGQRDKYDPNLRIGRVHAERVRARLLDSAGPIAPYPHV